MLSRRTLRQQKPAAENARAALAHGVEFTDETGVRPAHLEVLPVNTHPAAARRRDDAIRELVLRQFFRLRAPIRLVDLVNERVKVGRRLDEIVAHVRVERRPHVRPVRVGDRAMSRDKVRPAAGGNGELGQARREQEIADPIPVVELQNLRHNGEGRIIQHDAVLRIVEVLEVAAGPKRADDLRTVEAVLIRRPVRDRVVDVLRRVAVVGGFRRLELLDEGRVFDVVVFKL